MYAENKDKNLILFHTPFYRSAAEESAPRLFCFGEIMARGEHPNSRKALEQNREKTQFNGETAVKAGQKSQEIQAAAKEVMWLIAGKLPPGEAADVFVQKMMNGDLNAWRLFLEYTTSKPATKIEAEMEDRTLNVIINGKSEY